MAEVAVTNHELLFDHYRMPKATGGVAKFEHSETSVAIIHPQDRDVLQPQFCIDMSRQRISLHAIVLKIGEVPRNAGFRNRGIG
jgi:hypothetical protein